MRISTARTARTSSKPSASAAPSRVADLIRRFTSLASLGRLDEVFRQFKLVNVSGDILNFWKR